MQTQRKKAETTPTTAPQLTTTKIPWCSVIIPALNEAANLSKCLARLSARTPTNSFEVIVADGGSTDGTPALARRCGARVVHCTRGRAPQMNAGARHARGRHLYFLHADTLVPDDWLGQLRSEPTSLPRCFRLRFSGQSDSFWLRSFAFLSRFDVDAFRYGDQSLCVRKQDFEAVGGFDEALRVFEDHDLALRLKRHCGGMRILPQAVITSDRKYRRNGILFTQAVFVYLYLAYSLGSGQRRLVRMYGRLLK